MIISALKQTSPENITVIFEDGSEVRSTLGVISELRLYAGRDVDENLMEQLCSLSVRYLSLGKAIEVVSRRQMSGKELHDKLLLKGMDDNTADFCVAKLTDLGFINEEEYALAIVRHYSAKGYGAARIRSELIRRGINRELQESAIEQIPESSEKIDNYIASHLKDSSDNKEIKKITDALFRRGFSWEEISKAIRRYNE